MNGVLGQVKGLVDKIQRSQNIVKEYNSANRALINKLLSMESAYKQKSQPKMPDYSNILPKAENSSLPKVSTKEQLKEQASDYITELKQQNKIKAENKAQEQISKIQLKQIKGYENLNNQEKIAFENFSSGKENITEKTIRQGLTNSSITKNWHDENSQEYFRLIDQIRLQHRNYMDELNRQIEIVNSAKQQSLSEYNLKMAAEYEKKLKNLQDEQIKSISELNSYNQLYDAQEKSRQQEIEKLQQEWTSQQEQIQKQQFEKELKDGYAGEKALEMENRYKQALSFYQSLDKKRALGFIEENSAELKKTLGVYYQRLLNDIKK